MYTIESVLEVIYPPVRSGNCTSINAQTSQKNADIVALSWETQGGSGDDGWLTIWDFFIPAYTCPWDNERVGRFGDGGKWICGMSRYSAYEEERALVVYSFGVRDDSSFEEEMLTNTNCEIVAVDFSVDSVRHISLVQYCLLFILTPSSQFGDQLTAGHRNRSTFMKVGLGAKDEPFKDPPFYTLKTLMEKHAHDYIDVLKVDIEGGEFDSITRFMDDYEGEDLPIGQLVMELHLDDPIRWDFYKVYAFMERLESFGLRITAYELNMGSLSRGPPKYNEVSAIQHWPPLLEIHIL